jgi:DNA-binding response OmpR family regulator
MIRFPFASVREAGSEIGMMSAIDEYGQLAHLVLMDINLNGESGFELIEKLRNIEQYQGIPVMVLSQNSDRESVSLARLAGVKGFIVKPILPDILIERVSKVLSEI